MMSETDDPLEAMDLADAMGGSCPALMREAINGRNRLGPFVSVQFGSNSEYAWARIIMVGGSRLLRVRLRNDLENVDGA